MADSSDDMPNALRAPAPDLFRAVFERALDAMLITDDDGRYLDGNPAALALLGVSHGELTQRTIGDFTPGDDGDQRAATWRAFLAAGTRRGRFELRRPDGGRRVVEVDAVARVLPGRHLIVLHDITAHERADDDVARLAAIVASAHDAITGADLDGRLNYWSPSAERVYGWPAEDVLGKPASILMVDATEQDRIFERIRRGEVARHEGMRRRKDGSRFHAAVTVAPVVRDGVVVAAAAVTRDITAQRMLEQQLAVADRLAMAGTLAAGVAHEINNPLAAVAANLEHVARALTDESLREAVTDARDAARRIAEIVRDLRFLANPDSSRTSIDVREVLVSTVRIAAQEIRARARLVQDYGPTPRVLANAARLGQVLVNLIVNAAQAIPEGDADGHEVYVGARTDDAGCAVITVRDTGRGIAPEHVARIFDPFFTTRPFEGSGLGLAICHRLITEMGGEIRVSSSDHGSSFEVVLPPAERPAAAAPSAPKDEPRTTGRRILVIDDEPIVGRAVRRVLQPAHEVTAVTSARAALDLFAAGERFDLILCDLMMPQMTGMELYDHLRASAPEIAARMVFLTGGAFTPAARAFVARIGNLCFEKPFDAAQLRELAAKHLAG